MKYEVQSNLRLKSRSWSKSIMVFSHFLRTLYIVLRTLKMFPYKDDQNRIRDISSQPEFKIQAVGFFLLVLTSVLFFLKVKNTWILFMLGVSFSAYPLSELVKMIRLKEPYYPAARNTIYVLLIICFLSSWLLPLHTYAFFSAGISLNIYFIFIIVKRLLISK